MSNNFTRTLRKISHQVFTNQLQISLDEIFGMSEEIVGHYVIDELIRNKQILGITAI